jgi:gliding motility-associated-like protein
MYSIDFINRFNSLAIKTLSVPCVAWRPCIADSTNTLMRKKTTLFILAIYHILPFCAAQNECDNIGFENGNFTGWRLEYGQVSNATNSTIVVYTNPILGTLSQGHLIMTRANGNDPNITVENIPVVAPGGNFSARIGNKLSGRFYDRITRTVRVTQDNSLFLYKFAIVLQNPDPRTHTQYEQPKFIVKVADQSGNSNDCNTYQVYASTANTGFKSQGSGTNLLVYRNWTTAALDLRTYIGQTITISVTTTDCTEGAHFGYAYFDAECLSSKITASTDCANNSLTLKAPTGFEKYTWSTGDTSEILKISNPILGTRYTVKVKPFYSISNDCDLNLDYTVTNISARPDTTFIPLTTCNPRDTGVVLTRLTNSSGCDSFVQKKTILLRGRDTTFVPLTTCNPRDTGVVLARLTNSVGCDSFVQKKTILLRGRDTTFIPLTSCNPRDTGVVLARLTNSVGCDSFVQRKTILLRGRDTTFIRLTSCNPRDTGVVLARLTNSVGCDSFVQSKTILLRGRDTTFIPLKSCNPRDTGVVFTRFTNSVGCDSFVQKKTILLRGRDTTFINTVICTARDTGLTILKLANINGCDSFVSIKKQYNPVSVTILAIPSDCSGETGQITVSQTTGGKSPYKYALTDTLRYQTSAIFSNLKGQYHKLFVKDAFACTYTFDKILVQKATCRVFIPNAFSPNNDQENDVFKIYASPNHIKTIKSFRIFNRWGDLVFDAPNKNTPFTQFSDWWDGTFHDKPLPPDVFVYVIEVEYFDAAAGDKGVLKGDVTLIR